MALGEFAEGFESTEHPIVVAVRKQHTVLPIDEQTASVCARTVRALRRQGRLIGASDLWIGASSLRHGLPLLTSNRDELRRIEGLGVLRYGEEERSEEE